MPEPLPHGRIRGREPRGAARCGRSECACVALLDDSTSPAVHAVLGCEESGCLLYLRRPPGRF